MPINPQQEFHNRLPAVDENDPQYVTELVDALLAAAQDARASDVHIVPGQEQLELSWRIDGVLQPVTTFPAAIGPRVAARLKVMSNLLTYQTDVPQEGRILTAGESEIRVSTFPTLFGEKVVIRLFAGPGKYDRLDNLGLPAEVLEDICRLLEKRGGVFVVAGPAGSGKTTTNYACLREIIDKSAGARSLVSMEDPVEVVVPGVAQSQVNAAAGFDLTVGLRSLMRQDPEVIMVGEIRDREVANTVFEASLTGQLVITTFHAGSAAEAVSRLTDMGIEPFLLKSGLLAIVSQHLVRRLCECSQAGRNRDESLGLSVERFRHPVGCSACHGTGYRGRIVLAELLKGDCPQLHSAFSGERDARSIEETAVASGMVSCQTRALAAVEEGVTSPAEVRRVLGW